jgi:hypothetical protein
MTMSPELVELLTDSEIDRALDRLAAKRVWIRPDDIDALAAIDADVTLLQGERAWRAHMRRKYARDDASD